MFSLSFRFPSPPASLNWYFSIWSGGGWRGAPQLYSVKSAPSAAFQTDLKSLVHLLTTYLVSFWRCNLEVKAQSWWESLVPFPCSVNPLALTLTHCLDLEAALLFLGHIFFLILSYVLYAYSCIFKFMFIFINLYVLKYFLILYVALLFQGSSHTSSTSVIHQKMDFIL